MRKHNSNICHVYKCRINDEVAAGEFSVDYLTVSALKNSHVTPAGKKVMGVPEADHITMHDVHKKAMDILPRMRFMYLLSLLEAFFKDYVCERDGIDASQLKTQLRTETSNWARVSNNKSTSFYHIPYSLFIIKSKYGIDVTPKLNNAMLEAGILRNCIAHHDGELVDQFFLSGLREISSYQGSTPSLNDFVVVDKILMTLFIEEARKIIDYIDY